MLTTMKWQVLKNAAIPMKFSPRINVLYPSIPQHTTAPYYLNFKLSGVNLHLRRDNVEWILFYL